MKKAAISLLILILSLSANSLKAQNYARHNFEFGAGINLSNILLAKGSDERGIGGGLYFEYRYNYNKNLDFGGQINYRYSESTTAPLIVPSQEIVYNQIGLKGIVDYNMLPGKLVRPFIGASAGTICSLISYSVSQNDSAWFGTIGPRIGVNIWKIRICLDFDFAYNFDYGFISPDSSMALNISFGF